MGAVDLSVSDADLDLLDAYLLSDQSPPECMLLSDLDGFLTGIAIGPEVVMPSEWLPHVWDGEEPVFDDHVQASAILGTIMGRYNMILREVEAGAFGPLFWETQDGTVIAADWAEGFMRAVALRADAWEPLLRSKRQGRLLFPILALCSDEQGDSALGLEPEEEDRVMAEAAEFIPVCVTEIAAYWRKRRPTQVTGLSQPVSVSLKANQPGHNAPCPYVAPGANTRPAAVACTNHHRGRWTWRFLCICGPTSNRLLTRAGVRPWGLISRCCPRLLPSAIGSSLKLPNSPIQAKSHPALLSA
jgi:uncharacterized protein